MPTDPWLAQRAWELSRVELEQRSRRWYDQVVRIFESSRTRGIREVHMTGAGVGASRGKQARSERLASLQFAVEDLVETFDDQERQDLRERGVLPEGFVEAAISRAKVVQRQIKW